MTLEFISLAEHQRVKDELAAAHEAINTYLDASENGFTSFTDEATLSAEIDRMHRAIAGLYKVTGRKVQRPDFENDDQSWHIGLEPANVKHDWLAIWGDVAEPETEEGPPISTEETTSPRFLAGDYPRLESCELPEPPTPTPANVPAEPECAAVPVLGLLSEDVSGESEAL